MPWSFCRRYFQTIFSGIILSIISLKFINSFFVRTKLILNHVMDWRRTDNNPLLSYAMITQCRTIRRLASINSSYPNTAYMRQWTGSTLVQVTACRLFGAKPLPEPMLTYCHLDPYEQTSVKLKSKYKILISFEIIVCEIADNLTRGRWVKWLRSIGVVRKYPPIPAHQTHLTLKSGEISRVRDLFLGCVISLKFGTEHGSDTVVLFAKCQTRFG